MTYKYSTESGILITVLGSVGHGRPGSAAVEQLNYRTVFLNPDVDSSDLISTAITYKLAQGFNLRILFLQYHTDRRAAAL